jgi:hypothetical protein
MDGILIAPLARDLSGLSRLGLQHQCDAKKGRQKRSNHAGAYEASPPDFGAFVFYVSSTQIGSSLVADTPGDDADPAEGGVEIQASALKNIEKPAAVAAAFSNLANPAATVVVIPVRMANT